MKRAYANGILLDGTEQMEPVRGKVLLTENDKITAIADAGVSLDGYEVIDLHGGYLCPGLINLHVHLAGNGKPSAKPRDNAALVRKILSNGLTRAIAYRLVCSYAKLELLGGVSNRFALYTATLRNAQLAGIGDVTGSIAPGKSADFIVTRENPLEDLRALQHLELVVCRGRAVKKPSPKRKKEVDALLDPYLV